MTKSLLLRCVVFRYKVLKLGCLLIGPGNRSPSATNVVLVLLVILVLVLGVVVIRFSMY